MQTATPDNVFVTMMRIAFTVKKCRGALQELSLERPLVALRQCRPAVPARSLPAQPRRAGREAEPEHRRR